MNKLHTIKTAAILFATCLPLGFLFSCSEADSNLVEYVEDHKLDTPNDSVYSIVGIIGDLQKIADRTVLLGELRGELTTVTDFASTDLQDIANFQATVQNAYNQPADYYAVIQDCNYFIANVDTTITKRGENIFIREYAAAKAFRAWTYLQLALAYGKVPFVDQPLLTEKEANPGNFPKYDIVDIAKYFINDLQPYIDTPLPQYGSLGNGSSSYYFIPVRLLLGDLCLYAGRYEDAARYYHDYLTLLNHTRPIGVNSVRWYDKDFQSIINSSSSSANITYIPMETSLYDGIISYLPDIFLSTEQNNYYYQATASPALRQLSRAQRYTLVYTDPATQLPDTISQPEGWNPTNEDMRGDLRLYSCLTLRSSGTSNSNYSSVRQTISKFPTTVSSSDSERRSILSRVNTYTLVGIYLRYAEALNRAGFPQSAFAVLKYGLWYQTIEKYVSAEERERAGDLISFSQYSFTRDNTIGIHSRGSGEADCDTTYAIPAPDVYVEEMGRNITTSEDSILYVENRIADEMALELAFEGNRFGDLMRISLHRNDPTFLAERVARRQGTVDATLYTRLSNTDNWYLPLP